MGVVTTTKAVLSPMQRKSPVVWNFRCQLSWRKGGLLAGLSLALVWSYWPTLRGMADRWSHDPQYSHGYLVPVFALVVLWLRGEGRPTSVATNWWGVPILAAGVLLRLAGARYYVEWLDAVSLLPTLAGACLLLAGWPALRWALPAIAFLVFMIPFPYQVEVALAHPLQRLATAWSTYALQVLGLPALAEGNIIVIDEVRLGVLEACSGLGMLATFAALSTAVALVIRRRWPEKLAILASAVPVAVLANVARITLTGVLHRTAGSTLANAVFHDLAGWLMMPLALGLLWLELMLLDRLLVEPEAAGPVPVVLTDSPTSDVPGERAGHHALTADLGASSR
jgi:exosortase